MAGLSLLIQVSYISHRGWNISGPGGISHDLRPMIRGDYKKGR